MIRAATVADSDTLVAFTLSEALDAERRALNRAEVQRGIAGAFATPPKARYWVVESGGPLVGCASIVTEWSNFRGGDYWWIQSLYIVPEHRGHGLVDTILQHLVAEARAGGCARSAALRLQHQRPRPARRTSASASARRRISS